MQNIVIKLLCKDGYRSLDHRGTKYLIRWNHPNCSNSTRIELNKLKIYVFTANTRRRTSRVSHVP